MQIWIDEVPSPIGRLRLAVEPESGALVALEFDAAGDRFAADLARGYAGATITAKKNPCGITTRLRAYFDGDLAALDDIPVAARGTAFQQRVWNELRRIPAGTTTTYGAVATALGQPGAARAVGLANGRNPVAIVVPCHRVIGAGGALTGYGGGLDRKRWLLAHEARHVAGPAVTAQPERASPAA
jgi:methylated-DNA-[protein]-cysteine S-methyltransferase